MGLLLRGLGLSDGPDEVGLHDLQHAHDTAGVALRTRVSLAVVKTGIRHVVLGVVLDQGHLCLRGGFVELVEDVDDHVQCVETLLGLLDNGFVLRLLLPAQLDGLRLGILDFLDGLRQIIELQGQTLAQSLQRRKLAVEGRDLLRGVLTLLRGLGHSLIAPALLVGLVSRLLLQALDELLDERLNLGEVILADLAGKRGQESALQLHAAGPKQGLDGLPARIRIVLDGAVAARQGEQGDARCLVLLCLGLDGLHGIGVVGHGLGTAKADALLGEADGVGRGLLADGGLHDVDGLGQDLDLVRTHLRALVPGLGLIRAHFRELRGILLVVDEVRGHRGEPLARTGDVGDGLLLVLLGLLQLRSLLFDEVGLLLHELVVQAHGFDLGLVDLGPLGTEVLLEAFQGLDDGVGFELVVLHRHIVGLQEGGEI
mmetsp:Transcript_63893/g.161912  ORF Transcript_63893/g.161912 Transcript_63893/m.161912 type:complete len:428 (+) Transcript_63893:388-1671(+)